MILDLGLGRVCKLDRRSIRLQTRRVMMQHRWPGNVRELSNAVERALLISDTSEIISEDLMLSELRVRRPVPEPTEQTPAAPMASETTDYTFFPTTPDEIIPLEDVKHKAVLHAYQLCEGNIEKTAKKLDVSRSTVYRILKKIEEPVSDV